MSHYKQKLVFFSVNPIYNCQPVQRQCSVYPSVPDNITRGSIVVQEENVVGGQGLSCGSRPDCKYCTVAM